MFLHSESASKQLFHVVPKQLHALCCLQIIIAFIGERNSLKFFRVVFGKPSAFTLTFLLEACFSAVPGYFCKRFSFILESHVEKEICE